MNTPKPKQLKQRKPKQRENTLTKYRGPIAMHARLPRVTVYKYAPGGLRIDEEGQEPWRRKTK